MTLSDTLSRKREISNGLVEGSLSLKKLRTINHEEINEEKEKKEEERHEDETEMISEKMYLSYVIKALELLEKVSFFIDLVFFLTEDISHFDPCL